LLVVEISESDFLVLKQEQSLNVDYQEFPAMLSQLFEYCMNSSKEGGMTFRAIVDMTRTPDCTFSIIEASNFKNHQHLLLKLRTANDEQLKKHLAHGLSLARRENEKLRETQVTLNENLDLSQKDAERVGRE
jgi:spindle assembly abnormal protein 6